MMDASRSNDPVDPDTPKTPSGLLDPSDAVPATRPGWTEPVPITFTGTGSEYFRIWIVNLLLMLVTAGIYYPWAKARRLRYFHANTRIGEHAFSFHGEGRSMVRGFIVMAVLLLAVSFSGELSPAVGLLATLLLVAAAPMLLRLSLQFRMTQTRWRGLRFSFDGTLREAWRAAALMLLFGGAIMANPLLKLWATGSPWPPLVMLSVGLDIAVLCLLPLLPLAHRKLLAYRQGHIRHAGERSSFSAPLLPFYAPIFKALVLSLVVGMLTLATSSPWLLVPLGLVTWLLSMAIWQAGIQNVVWSNTRLPQVELHSRLASEQLALRYAANAIGMVFTLGLYWPFAAIATARLRLSAVSVSFGPDFEQAMAEPVRAVDDARGDAAADLAGFDLGL
ncbi:uncharacterized membrane protein YjgN (DUF898 family) [Sphaerotilus mobilis]|uniref:Uncharacterized membrane protein YjgN (DUF898 family) n=2 Tax=Sphaerotilus mobilis TaxID=47994 RepID=A0A4Q7LGB2_9BURK|nr:uncharacterized membrane protein YjgN (DUF898 family) [Sphaerotilus mobilis]